MAWTDVFSIIDTILQIVVLAVSVYIVVWRMSDRGSSVVLGFFLYALICLLLSDLNWAVLITLKPDFRVPFGVGEIADIGTFLLLATMLNEAFHEVKAKTGFVLFLSVVFSLAVIALWIGWAGEWIKSIVGGVAFGYFMCIVIIAVKKAAVLKPVEEVLIGLFAYALLILQSIIFVLPQSMGKKVDILCYIFMGVSCVLLVVKCLTIIRKAAHERSLRSARAALAFTSLCVVWIQNTLYSSAEPFYTIVDILLSFMIMVLVMSVLLVDEAARYEAETEAG